MISGLFRLMVSSQKMRIFAKISIAMFIFKLTYKKPLTEVDRFLAAHREFLDRFYQAGKLVASGPREPRVGGVILCNAATEAEAREIIAQDPFFEEEVAEYEVVQFHATKHNVDNFLGGIE